MPQPFIPVGRETPSHVFVLAVIRYHARTHTRSARIASCSNMWSNPVGSINSEWPPEMVSVPSYSLPPIVPPIVCPPFPDNSCFSDAVVYQ